MTTPADLFRHPLLHDAPKDGWPRWLEMQGVTGGDTGRGFTFNDSGTVLQAAKAGLGVALGRSFLAADDLVAGRLVIPVPQFLQNDYSYWLVYPQTSAKPARVKAVRSWLLAEAGGQSKE